MPCSPLLPLPLIFILVTLTPRKVTETSGNISFSGFTIGNLLQYQFSNRRTIKRHLRKAQREGEKDAQTDFILPQS